MRVQMWWPPHLARTWKYLIEARRIIHQSAEPDVSEDTKRH